MTICLSNANKQYIFTYVGNVIKHLGLQTYFVAVHYVHGNQSLFLS